MANQIRVKILAKALSNTKYHLSTFNQPISKNSQLPQHLIKEATLEDHENYVENKGFDIAESRKKLKPKLLFEEIREDDSDPVKFLGYDIEEGAPGRDGLKNPSNHHSGHYAVMIYDAKKNAFKMVPILKHYKFEKKCNLGKKTQDAVNEEQLQKSTKISKIQQMRNRINRSLKENSKSALIETQRIGGVLVVKEPPKKEEEKEGAKNKKKPKKKHFEKEDFDYEDMVQDDEDDFNINKEEEDDLSEEEENLDDDGKQVMKEVLEKEENERINEHTHSFRIKLSNLEVMKEDSEELVEDEEGGDSESSFASIFGDADDNEVSESVGSKRSAQQMESTSKPAKGETVTKRQKQ